MPGCEGGCEGPCESTVKVVHEHSCMCTRPLMSQWPQWLQKVWPYSTWLTVLWHRNVACGWDDFIHIRM